MGQTVSSNVNSECNDKYTNMMKKHELFRKQESLADAQFAIDHIKSTLSRLDSSDSKLDSSSYIY